MNKLFLLSVAVFLSLTSLSKEIGAREYWQLKKSVAELEQLFDGYSRNFNHWCKNEESDLSKNQWKQKFRDDVLFNIKANELQFENYFLKTKLDDLQKLHSRIKITYKPLIDTGQYLIHKYGTNQAYWNPISNVEERAKISFDQNTNELLQILRTVKSQIDLLQSSIEQLEPKMNEEIQLAIQTYSSISEFHGEIHTWIEGTQTWVQEDEPASTIADKQLVRKHLLDYEKKPINADWFHPDLSNSTNNLFKKCLSAITKYNTKESYWIPTENVNDRIKIKEYLETSSEILEISTMIESEIKRAEKKVIQLLN